MQFIAKAVSIRNSLCTTSNRACQFFIVTADPNVIYFRSIVDT